MPLGSLATLLDSRAFFFLITVDLKIENKCFRYIRLHARANDLQMTCQSRIMLRYNTLHKLVVFHPVILETLVVFDPSP